MKLKSQFQDTSGHQPQISRCKKSLQERMTGARQCSASMSRPFRLTHHPDRRYLGRFRIFIMIGRATQVKLRSSRKSVTRRKIQRSTIREKMCAPSGSLSKVPDCDNIANNTYTRIPSMRDHEGRRILRYPIITIRTGRQPQRGRTFLAEAPSPCLFTPPASPARPPCFTRLPRSRPFIRHLYDMPQ